MVIGQSKNNPILHGNSQEKCNKSAKGLKINNNKKIN